MTKFACPPTPVSLGTNAANHEWSPPQQQHHAPLGEGIAIVGMSCRTAGGNDTPEKLWRFLMEKKHGSGEVPKKRWEPWVRRHPHNAKVIQSTTSKGYFLEDLEKFDAAFFGISPIEAESMDPHHRLGLELSWEALENAGINPQTLAGSDTAVFMGVDSDDYSRLVLEDLPNISAFDGIGTGYHGVCGRVSYHLDLMGPSTAVDAACASSLIAIHLGRQAILSGESRVALCGGVNVLCAPALTHVLQKAGALSQDGVCLSFDDDAHGYARGEGGAVVVLKHLPSAIKDGDNILAVLKGTATAADGKTNGIMAPNAEAQELVARKALQQAGGLDPLTVGYIEAHATSTSLGDPVEVGALSKVYGTGRPKEHPCAIGSLKPNVGHLEAAAGAVGFVKAVLAVNKGELAPQTLLEKLNSRVDWEASGLEVVREGKAWPESNGPRRAACCSYGYSGSVAHAIIEHFELPISSTKIRDSTNQETPPMFLEAQRKHSLEKDIPDEPVPILISSFQEKRLSRQAELLAHWLETEGRTVSLKSVASTLAQRRAAHDYRAGFVAATHNEACEALQDFSSKGRLGSFVTSNRVLGNTTKKDVVWVYSGHGAQWDGMGKEMLQNPVFYRAIMALEDVVRVEAGFSALEALELGENGDRVQVLTYLMQFGLTEVLRSKGIEPQAIIGHSVGEIAASVAAGSLSPEEGVIIVSRRAELYRRVQGQGGMSLIGVPFREAENHFSGRNDIAAAINSSPSSCVISGTTEAMEEYVQELRDRDIKAFRVNTDIAFHSPMLKGLVEPLKGALEGVLNPRPPNVALYSTSCVNPRTDSLRDADYWVSNMVNPVLLCEALEAAIEDGMRIFLEIATHPIVSQSINDVLIARNVEESATVSIMKRNTSSRRSIVCAIAELHTLGIPIDYGVQLGKTWHTQVPRTPWVQKPYWKNASAGLERSSQLHDVEKHTLLGQNTRVADSTTRVFTTFLDDKTKPYPLTHCLDATEIIPLAVYCNTFHQATGATILKDLQLSIPTTMTADLREIQVIVKDQTTTLFSRHPPSQDVGEINAQTWTRHSSCTWSQGDMSAYRSSHDIESTKRRIGTLLPSNFALDFLESIGVSGIAYPWVVLEHYGNEKEMVIKIDMDPESDSITWDRHSWAPFLDAATSVGSSVFFKSRRMRIISSIDEVQFISSADPPKIGYLYVENVTDKRGLAANVSVLSVSGEVLAKLECMRFSDVEMASDQHATGIDAICYRMAWIPPAFAENPCTLKNMLIISDDTFGSERYADQLVGHVDSLVQVSTVKDIDQPDAQRILSQKNTFVIYIPGQVDLMEDVPEKAHAFTWEAACIVKRLSALSVSSRLFVLTADVQKGASPTALAQAPLYGFARIAAQEHPEIWGGLVDTEETSFPLLAIKYVQGQDVIQMSDGLPRVARLRPFAKSRQHNDSSPRTLLPKPQGTYIVTGGFGDLGLEVLDFLSRKGARRIVVVSRSKLPSRREWPQLEGRAKNVIDRVMDVEKRGTTIYSVALDIGEPGAGEALTAALDKLSLPPVLGIVHAAGISEDALITATTRESFARVFGPKVSGALALHDVFPPGDPAHRLDFFVLFSSIGQLVGTPGQAAYGAANAFLDGLATHRKKSGDNCVAFQWTAWRGKGLARDAEFLNEELKAKGITDISCEEGFQAWEEVDRLDTGHAVVTRTRVLDEDEEVPFPLVAEVVRRRRGVEGAMQKVSKKGSAKEGAMPRGEDLKPYVLMQIRQCLSTVLHLDVEDIDNRAAMADLGVDSVMGAGLRREVQKQLGVKMSPSLLWKADTVQKLSEWTYKQIREEDRDR